MSEGAVFAGVVVSESSPLLLLSFESEPPHAVKPSVAAKIAVLRSVF